MVGQVFDVVTVAVAVVALMGLVVFLARPDRSRQEEDAARRFFDAHGHWPDEPAPRAAPEPRLTDRRSG